MAVAGAAGPGEAAAVVTVPTRASRSRHTRVRDRTRNRMSMSISMARRIALGPWIRPPADTTAAAAVIRRPGSRTPANRGLVEI
ncbi:hypothetical protein Snoj_31990 [Streptomyces nojiriensis]|uniref:Uncharacterized protein n=1 Tax=Streptomyces nojiriensis TaxID=66374 RepID=A0ABQ3SMB3_9ACTN|nr:hypothetical protein GCM10010205_54170 [Streptomyces nojiriensis]GHI69281.1 hypothetical protein Snoj_31990 [Streptomyces nojiriensis]